MASAQSLGEHKPKACVTGGIQDLADCVGWGAAGRGLYGMELLDGLYRRASIPITMERVEPNWDIKLIIQQPFIHIKKKSVVKKLENSGTMLVSYVSPTSDIDLSGESGLYHLSSSSAANLEAVAVQKKDFDLLSNQLPEGSVVYLEVLLGDIVPSEPVAIIPALGLRWTAQDKKKTVGIAIKMQGNKPPLVQASIPSVLPFVESAISISWIKISKNLAFKKLYFGKSGVTDAVLERLVKNIAT